ncbi:MAG: hypothetical protein LBR53_07115 [Deltaproteobacteria bacterium]|nr:hypothetical protein [Deltaproteobacteria bacterium]
MTTDLQILQVQTEQLVKRITQLYSDYYANVQEIKDKSLDKPILPLIEELHHNLMNEVSILEEKYKLLCIKTLSNKLLINK